MPIKLFPSLIAADKNSLLYCMKNIEPFVDGFHIDITDNIFVPNAGFSMQEVETISNHTLKPLWIHLMVNNPKKWLMYDFLYKKNNIITIHYETIHNNPNKQKIITSFKKQQSLFGIAINPETIILAHDSILPHIDYLIIMGVNPGKSGQTYITKTNEKIDAILKIKNTLRLNFQIGIDGGITEKIFSILLKKKINLISVGSTFFQEINYVKKIKQWRNIIEKEKPRL